MPLIYPPETEGIVDWGLDVDDNGQRSYYAVFQVKTDPVTETEDDTDQGPAAVYNFITEAVPPGSLWAFGEDSDEWAFAHWDVSVKPVVTGENNALWHCRVPFRTQPVARCQYQPVTDPLLEPQIIEGSFSKYTKEVSYDRFGALITNSAWELLRGQVVEFDFNRPSVTIEQVVADLNYDQCAAMVDTVNDTPIWGFPSRCVKLSDFKWSRLLYGQYATYWKRKFTFDVNIDLDQFGNQSSGFDRTVLDEANKALHGQWSADGSTWMLLPIGGSPPDPANPLHFDRLQDRFGNPMHAILNGFGVPYSPTSESGNISACGCTSLTSTIYSKSNSGETAALNYSGGSWTGISSEGNEITLTCVGGDSWQLTVVSAFNPAGDAGSALTPPACPPLTILVQQTISFDAKVQTRVWQFTATSSQQTAGQIVIQYYQESDFTMLGVPADLSDSCDPWSPGSGGGF
jgi:hypothetical protein